MILSPAAGLLVQIRPLQLHSHSVLLVSLAEALTSPNLPRDLDLVKNGFRVLRFLARDSMHSEHKWFIDKRHRLDLLGEQF